MYQKYDKSLDYSYTFGLFPTFELLKNCSNNAEKLIFSSKLIKTTDVGNLIDLAHQKNVEIETNDKLINKLSPKENCFVIGVFKKFKCEKRGRANYGSYLGRGCGCYCRGGYLSYDRRL